MTWNVGQHIHLTFFAKDLSYMFCQKFFLGCSLYYYIVTSDVGLIVMMEKEISQVGKKRKDTLIRFGKKDGDVRLGKVYVLYPEELEDLQKQITDAHEEIARLRNKIAGDDTIKLDEIVGMINKMDNRVSKLETDVFKLK